MAPRTHPQESITNLDHDLISNALEMVQGRAYPFNQRSIGEERDSLSRGEYIPCAIAIVLLTSAQEETGTFYISWQPDALARV